MAHLTGFVEVSRAEEGVNVRFEARLWGDQAGRVGDFGSPIRRFEFFLPEKKERRRSGSDRRRFVCDLSQAPVLLGTPMPGYFCSYARFKAAMSILLICSMACMTF